MFLRSWAQGHNGAHLPRPYQHHEKHTFGAPTCNEKVEGQSQYGLLNEVRCYHHTSDCRCIRRRLWLHRAQWCLLIIPLWLLVRPRNSLYEGDFPGSTKRPIAHQQEPLYAMSNYSVSALKPHAAYGASNAHAINVHANVVVPNVTCTLSPNRLPQTRLNTNCSGPCYLRAAAFGFNQT
jgi:hypothetical protein